MTNISSIDHKDQEISKVPKTVDEAFGMIKPKYKSFTDKDYKEAIINSVVEKYKRKESNHK